MTTLTPGRYTARLMVRETDTLDFTERFEVNLENMDITQNGDLYLKRTRNGAGEFDGELETVVMFAKGMWSNARADLQLPEERTPEPEATE